MSEAAAAQKAEDEAARARGDVIDTADTEKADKEAAEAAAKVAAEDEAAKKAAADKAGTEDEDEETADEKAERETAEKAAADKAEREKRIRIPKARFDEAMSKARAREAALQKQLDDIQNAGKRQEQQDVLSKMETKLSELDDKYEELMMDAKRDEARKVRLDRDALRAQINETRTVRLTTAARDQAIEQYGYDIQLTRLEQVYPELNPDSEAYSQEADDAVAALMQKLMKAGDTRSDALTGAARLIMGEPRKADATRSDEQDEVSKARAARELDARRKSAEAAKKAPPNLDKAGLDTDKLGGKNGEKIDVMRLTKSQFDKLTDEEKARLRGDVL